LKAKKNYCVIATENTKRPKISEIREDGKLILRCKFINQNQETIKAVLKQDMHHNKNGASANHTILRDANAADDMHAVSEDDASIGSLLLFVSVSDVATTPKTLFPSLNSALAIAIWPEMQHDGAMAAAEEMFEWFTSWRCCSFQCMKTMTDVLFAPNDQIILKMKTMTD
jgi:hypothetical protein